MLPRTSSMPPSIELKIACPHTVDNVKPLREVAGTKVHQAFLGTCTNGRLEDLAAAAEIVKGRRVASGTRLLVIPASSEIYLQAIASRLRADVDGSGRGVWHAGLRAVHGQSPGHPRAGRGVRLDGESQLQGPHGPTRGGHLSGESGGGGGERGEGRDCDPREIEG